MLFNRSSRNTSLLAITIVLMTATTTSADTPWDGSIVRYGTMHEAIGRQQHQGRVRLSDLVKRPHFYAVAALEGLKAEVTIDDGKITITGIGDTGRLGPVADTDGNRQATMLVGASVDSWSQHKVSSDVSAEDFDQFIADAASQAGLDLSKPFPFKIEGKFTGVRLHVIHGACPIHARMQKLDLPVDKRPFEKDWEQVGGKIIGVFAKDAVGKLTHPATSTHMHLLFKDEQIEQTVTGHIEQAGLATGCVLYIPKPKTDL